MNSKMAGRGSKPGERRGGRQKGTPNKLSGDVKAMIIGALEKKGGQKYLEQQATENPVAFMTLLGKVLPMTVATDPDNPLKVAHTIRWQVVDAQP